MKKISVLIGSPRKKGNSVFLAKVLAERLKAKFEIDTIYLYGFDIEPCIDCRACKAGDLICVLKDQMVDLYEKLENSEILIFATPIYWFGPTAQTKLLIDRFRPYFVNKKLNGKKAALLLPAGSGAGDCDLTIEMFKRIFNALEIEYLGVVTSESYNIGDAEKDIQINKQLEVLTEKMIEFSR
jgi:multimeric flavodoxin WrbA